MASDPQGLHLIGHVRSERTDPAHTPVQSALNPDETASIVLDEAYVAGLDGLGEFSHAWLLTWLGGSTASAPAVPLRQVPFLLRRAPRTLGIFATRGPRRVNPIGLSLITVVAVDGPVVTFRGVDVVDGTPVIDLKPYVTAFDRPPGVPRCGWFDTVAMELGATPASLEAAHEPGPYRDDPRP